MKKLNVLSIVILLEIISFKGAIQQDTNYTRIWRREICGNLQAMDPKSNICYRIGSKGPCGGSNMAFLLDPNNSSLGMCDCNKLGRRTLIYHEQTNQCYLIFQQGYCGPGNWLSLSQTTGKPVCEINPCQYQNIRASEEFVLFNNRCVKLGAAALECGRYEVITFVRDKIFPRCGDRSVSYALGPVNVANPCAPGSLSSITGGCQSKWIF